jgi:hypothetical protein
MNSMEERTPIQRRRSFRDVKRVRLGAVVAVALAVGFGAWLIARDGGDDSKTERAEPVATTVADLQRLDEQSGHPVYWVGPQPGTKYEVTRTSNGNVYIRYLTQAAAIGDERPNYLTVGSYPFKGAYATLRQSARQEGTKSGRLPNGGIYIVSRERPNSVYAAYRGTDLQIEVFSPSASQARQLVASGEIRPVG